MARGYASVPTVRGAPPSNLTGHTNPATRAGFRAGRAERVRVPVVLDERGGVWGTTRSARFDASAHKRVSLRRQGNAAGEQGKNSRGAPGSRLVEGNQDT